jgi:hypothetical protein
MTLSNYTLYSGPALLLTISLILTPLHVMGQPDNFSGYTTIPNYKQIFVFCQPVQNPTQMFWVELVHMVEYPIGLPNMTFIFTIHDHTAILASKFAPHAFSNIWIG